MLAKLINRLAYYLMRTLGWTFPGQKPPDKKFILIGAPHTSNWDFFITLALMHHFDIALRYMVKDQVFKGPWAGLLRSLGAIPIDRSRRVNVVDKTVEAFESRDQLVLGILPEGTRKRTEYWKSGFYHIALGAGVPLVLAKVNGKAKTLTLGPRIEVTGDIDADMARIAAYYEGAVAIYPECFGPVRLKPSGPDREPGQN